MRLIRIKLENWRGVQSSEIAFEAGVTIVEGANEAGKSSFIEALNLLFRERDSTRKQELKRVTPKGVDAGSLVEVELKSGDYHFTYTKTFNKKPSTSLFLHAPHVLQLTGADAHERVLKILDETIDFGLWQAIQLEQGNDFTQVNLKSSDSLAQALDSAAGGSGAGDGEAVLLEKVKSEYLLYYTERTGRETGELAKLRALVVSLEEQIEKAVAELTSMETYIERSSRLATEYKLAQAEIPLMQKQLEHHQQAQLQSVTLQEKRKNLDAQLQAQQLKVDALQTSLGRRQNIRLQLQQMQGNLKRTQLAVSALETKSEKAALALVDATTNCGRLIDNRLQIDDQLHIVEMTAQLRDKEKNHKLLASRLEKIATARKAINQVHEKISSVLIDEKTLAKIEQLEQDRRELEIRLSARSPEFDITALQKINVVVNGDVHKLTENQTIKPDTSTGIEIQLADLVTMQLTPASDLEALQEKLATVKSKLKKLLVVNGAGSVVEATTACRQRAGLESQKETLTARYKELLDGANEDDLQHQQQALAQKISHLEKQLARAISDVGDVAADADGLESLQQRLRHRLSAADLEISTHRQTRDDAQLRKAEADTELEVARQRYLGEKAAYAQLQSELTADGAVTDDRQLSSELEKQQLLLAELQSAVSAAGENHMQQKLDDADSLVRNALAALNRATADLHNIEKEQVELRARLDHMQAEGLHEKLELLRAEHDDANARLQQIERAANSARRLWTSLCHHQRVAQRSYARPLAERVAQMGRLVFGDDFSVALSESLTIESRTLNSLTVPFADLSGGAREQLGILLRLAAAQLVSGTQGMPLILDDTLGHTDPDRLETMGAILSNAGRYAQIVVMTCYPRRYGYVGEARVVKLGTRLQPEANRNELSGFAEPV